MDVTDMTPEQLRALAESKERIRASLEEEYLDIKSPQVLDFKTGAKAPARKPWEKDVEVEGVTYTLDMRRFKSRKVLKEIAKAQREAARRAKVYAAAVKAGKTPDEAERESNEGVELDEQLSYMTAMLGEDVEDAVAEAVTARMGYDDIEEIMRIEGLLVEAAQLKN